MKLKLLLISIVLFNKAIWGQQPTLTYFKLPVMLDNAYIPSNGYVSCNYQRFNPILLKDYHGSDEEILKLSTVIKAIAVGDRKGYLSLSFASDSVTEKSFKFYNFFVPRSVNPSLIAKTRIGDLRIFFVNLNDNFPLMTFGLVQAGSHLLNYPTLLNHPAITALTQAINHNYLNPTEFVLRKSIPAKNIQVIYDSTFRDWQKTFSFHFDLIKLNKECTNTKNGLSQENLSLKPYLDFYCGSLENIRKGNFDKYYSALSEGSRNLIKKSLRGVSKKGIESFKNYYSSLSLIKSIVDFGAVKLLLASKLSNNDFKNLSHVYLKGLGNKSIKWFNLNHEFYLNDLIRTPEFIRAISN